MKDQLTRKRLLDAALQYLGVKEVEGPGSNPLIIEWFKNWGVSWQEDDSKLAWCAVFMNEVCKQAGIAGTGKLNARSFLNAGEPTDKPLPGDFVVFWRGSINGWKGHIGIYIREDDKYIWTLGGNQANEVRISKYAKSRLLEYRTPISL